MNQFKLKTVLPFLIFMSIALSSCQAIATIFKAGAWFAIIGIIVIVIIILWLISKARKK